MGFFEKLTNTINSTSKEVEQKAKMVSGTVKLNSQIKDLSEEIQKYFKQVGELYYKKQGGVPESEEFTELFDKIRKNHEEIQAAEKQIETLKGIYRCQNCGAEMRMADNFCMMCGTKREDISPMIETATVDSEAVVTDIEEEQEQIEVSEFSEEEKEQTSFEEKEEITEQQEKEAAEKVSDEIQKAMKLEKEAEAVVTAEEEEDEAEGEGIDPSEFETGSGTSEKKLFDEKIGMEEGGEEKAE